jgi:ABC-type proline/glycine betaine transport system substrate-binding protein
MRLAYRLTCATAAAAAAAAAATAAAAAAATATVAAATTATVATTSSASRVALLRPLSVVVFVVVGAGFAGTTTLAREHVAAATR